MERSKILLLVEGEKVEKDLFEHFYNLYGINNVEIVAYKTHIYAFYNRLKNDYADSDGNIEFDIIDLPLFLNEYLNLEGESLLNEADFTDIILIFDFDPHDPQFDPNKLEILLDNFSDSTDRGKLFINYPMVESFKDTDSLDNPTFKDSTVHIDILKERSRRTSRYKRIVDSYSCIGSIEEITTEVANSLLKLHSFKLEYLLHTFSYTDEDTYKMLCKKQCHKLNNENLIWVINTSLLHMLDEYGFINNPED
ncbi:hypothetical protein [Metabacillus malikii]|uniref:Uncharacterized protein n=1 Tax=Metabacillus malikii TaxID=1504265 RepID=A0ABT9ZK51_9BACI|nr:hypothetical protein [Metabacillus malikii]MDQ0232147.1 hypothetical protein [Metabacillus malikii]